MTTNVTLAQAAEYFDRLLPALDRTRGVRSVELGYDDEFNELLIYRYIRTDAVDVAAITIGVDGWKARVEREAQEAECWLDNWIMDWDEVMADVVREVRSWFPEYVDVWDGDWIHFMGSNGDIVAFEVAAEYDGVRASLTVGGKEHFTALVGLWGMTSVDEVELYDTLRWLLGIDEEDGE